ncbi:MAG: hypothetical protein QGI29_01465 [Pirellulales bacterium]|nr:hypothetical protein [Pirellulales bacterium]
MEGRESGELADCGMGQGLVKEVSEDEEERSGLSQPGKPVYQSQSHPSGLSQPGKPVYQS